jgi:hypothetical protein
VMRPHALVKSRQSQGFSVRLARGRLASVEVAINAR